MIALEPHGRQSLAHRAICSAGARATPPTRSTDRARFRISIFSQRGNYSIVLRKLNTEIPTLES